jgi:hypothetical protein
MESVNNSDKVVIGGQVKGKGGIPISGVKLVLRKSSRERGRETWDEEALRSTTTDSEGRYQFSMELEEETSYRVEWKAFGKSGYTEPVVTPKAGDTHTRDTFIPHNFQITVKGYGADEKLVDLQRAVAGQRFLARLEPAFREPEVHYLWSVVPDATVVPLENGNEAEIISHHGGEITVSVRVRDENEATVVVTRQLIISEANVQMVGGNMNVRLERTATPQTLDQALWYAIRHRAQEISFDRYREFVDRVMAEGYDFHTPMGNVVLDPKLREVRSRRQGVQAYELLKVATQVFLLLHCGVKMGEERDIDSTRGPFSFDWMLARLNEYLGSPAQLPYLRRVIQAAFPWLERDGIRCGCVLTAVHAPCLIELIRDYWFEEGMLMQTMNAIIRRFQNVHAPGERDPLAYLEIDPLRPLGNILWGQSQDLNLLSVRRRAYEYMHEYGLALYGRATASLRPADVRSKFLEAFHNLLYLCSVFYKEDNDTTVIADGYPLLNALKEVHLILAQGAHNQFGDLPWTARAETLVQQWILAQPEIREFLQSRAMVPYTEAWMPQVDTMKTLQGWSDVTVSHFRDLGVYGEQIVLSIRYGDWIGDLNEDHAKNWARWFRSDIQAYLHAYRAATGVDLTNPDTVDATLPAIHLQKRLAIQQGSR